MKIYIYVQIDLTGIIYDYNSKIYLESKSAAEFYYNNSYLSVIGSSEPRVSNSFWFFKNVTFYIGYVFESWFLPSPINLSSLK